MGGRRPSFSHYPPSPRLPQYTMAPKEGPLAARPKYKETRREMGALDSPKNESGKGKGDGRKDAKALKELTNKEWAGGREHWEPEPKPTGAQRRDFLPRSPSSSFVS